MTQDDLLYRFRLRVFAIAAELGNVRAACRAMWIPPTQRAHSGRWTLAPSRSSCVQRGPWKACSNTS